MSKKYPLNTQKFELMVSGPASVEEYDALAKRPGACLEDAIENIIYRDTIPVFWSKFLPEMVKITGQPVQEDTAKTAKARERAKTPEAAAKVKAVDEAFGKYFTRTWATATDEQKAECVAAAQLVIDSISVDPSPSARAARGPGKDVLAKADSILELDADTIESKVAKILGVVPTVEITRDADGLPERESLAYAIKAYQDALL